MDTVSDIISALGGPAFVSRSLALTGASTVSEWKRKGSIPVRYWPALISVARGVGVALDERVLVSAHISQPSSPPAADEAA